MARSWLSLLFLALCLSVAFGDDDFGRKLLKTKVVTSTATCTASASAGASNEAASSCSELVTAVFATLCTKRTGPWGVIAPYRCYSTTTPPFYQRCDLFTTAKYQADTGVIITLPTAKVAEAFAKVLLSVKTTCTSSGNAAGCAVAVAAAKSYAQASATAFVKAFAAGFLTCPCVTSSGNSGVFTGPVRRTCNDVPCADDNAASTAATSGSTASSLANLYITLVAEADAAIYAASCSSGTGTSVSNLDVNCTAEVHVSTLVKTIVRALAEAKCYAKLPGSEYNVNTEASATALAEATVDYSASCKAKLTETGTAAQGVKAAVTASFKSYKSPGMIDDKGSDTDKCSLCLGKCCFKQDSACYTNAA